MLKAPTEDGEVETASLHAIEMLEDVPSDNDWAPCVTLGGKAQINKPGWEITNMWDGMYQAVAISSLYRFCGQGKTPSTALADAYAQMRKFSKELKHHMEQT